MSASEIMNDLWGKRRPQGVQNRERINDFLADRTGYWTQMTGGGEHHPGQAQDHATDGALERNGSHPAADMDEFIHFVQGVLHRNDVSRFRRHIAVLSYVRSTVARKSQYSWM